MLLLHVEKSMGKKSWKFQVSNTIFKRYLSLLSRTENNFRKRYTENEKGKAFEELSIEIRFFPSNFHVSYYFCLK